MESPIAISSPEPRAERMSHPLEGRSGRFVSSATEPTRGVVRDKHEVHFDEPTFLPVADGNDENPSPVDYLLSSLAGCQVSVLDQCLKKSRVEDYHIEAEATITSAGRGEIPDEMPSNTASRIMDFDIDITLTVPEEHRGRAERCLEVYDIGCIVGQSLRAGIDYTPTTTIEVSE